MIGLARLHALSISTVNETSRRFMRFVTGLTSRPIAAKGRSQRHGIREPLFETGKSKRFSNVAKVATRKLAQLDAANTLEFLRSPPGNRLEAMAGDRKGQYSIRVND